MVFTNNFRQKDASLVISMDDYTVNNVSINGREEIINTSSQNPDGNQGEFSFIVKIKNALIRDGIYILHWNTERTYEWFTNDTQEMGDDYIRIPHGTMTGKTPTKVPFSCTITKPLIKYVSCYWAAIGEFEINALQFNSLFDYTHSEEKCNNHASVHLNGNTFDVTIK